MIKSREEITKQCGELIDMVGELFDEKIKYERKFCEESRKRKEAETELADKNFRLEKIKQFIEEHNIIGANKEYLPQGVEKCYSVELMCLVEGKDEPSLLNWKID